MSLLRFANVYWLYYFKIEKGAVRRFQSRSRKTQSGAARPQRLQSRATSPKSETAFPSEWKTNQQATTQQIHVVLLHAAYFIEVLSSLA